ncbi:hydroxymethylglutaryl-coenzyme A reductase [Gemmatirosa kalamazoonensis]|uniref:hydroxymethylglutaryl-CoA reductase (NADPH) n=1 Tax=Gemmatirosa kalamazoonensis TaxID=861299 RepID=W0RMX7_9BACT|nr:hydroxymethylglutaryl-CoA reductase [Gemmatirosa kalamazoonensis]AHG91832.1 hydroxymethylglutaryl-coenzyme A reductase [Gemmatirosa kalamazoonensis]
MFVPRLLLKQLYTFGSLRNADGGVRFSIKNRLSDAELTGLRRVSVAGTDVPLDGVRVELPDGRALAARDLTPRTPVAFALRDMLDIRAAMPPLAPGKHHIEIEFDSRPFGNLTLDVEDSIVHDAPRRDRVPRARDDDYAPEIVAERQRFVERVSGASLEHTTRFSFDPHVVQGNCELFSGVAQIPLGFAGPLHVDGEHATGEFVIPLATTEGTLVASYNRGMQLVNASGGVRCTVVADAMQRAPVFVFGDARRARDFVRWVHEHVDRIREEAEGTSSVAKLQDIDAYMANKFAFLRFNYTTGDAAGQNMVGRATFAACSWLLDNYPEPVDRFYLESNFATDKKASHVNIMRTRGKRVTAEVTVPRAVLIERMRVEPETLVHHYGVANVGALLSGANNNGLHSANAITAMFIATGQDVANVAESSAGVVYAELTAARDLYMSITIPSLIVATHGGGTKLPTQQECLRVLGCATRGTVNKLAEIIAGVVLAGELSLASAISSSDWVSSHERYGRNR